MAEAVAAGADAPAGAPRGRSARVFSARGGGRRSKATPGGRGQATPHADKPSRAPRAVATRQNVLGEPATTTADPSTATLGKRRAGKVAKAIKPAGAKARDVSDAALQTYAGMGQPAPQALLAWYDRNRRVLPWRALPQHPSDPYRVWLSEIMLQQTTVAAVQPYYIRFLQRFPTVTALAQAPSEAVMQAWAGLGYYSRARNLHACAKLVAGELGGAFPDTLEGLQALPGVGPYTASAIGAIAFDLPAAAVDGNVERVLSRYFRIAEPMPAAKPLIRALAQALVPAQRPGDFAQAIMDLGATICTPRNPSCLLCPWQAGCAASAHGDMEQFPRKAAKKATPQRFGAAFVLARTDGAVLLRTRPPQGLLGGMDEPPGSRWHEAELLPEPSVLLAEAPLALDWRAAPGVVRHVFTHFRLELLIFVAVAPQQTPAPDGARWQPRHSLADSALPNVMRKAVAHGLDYLDRTARPRAKKMGQA